MASSHIPFVTGYLTNIYRNKYSFDGGFSNNPYLNISNNILHVSPDMWENINKKRLLRPFKFIKDICLLFDTPTNSHFIELYELGYSDAKKNKNKLNKFFDL
jgi:hypothetical protein